ncbi:isoprenylcysteine carboxyl methyltransferase family protein [Saccharopolyspora terrae]|uniref:isoprenylcysteine carboxyl methyltransferase family protein n=1 Tax=Saccharopolyspora terrae TaxID=2530384 RepID=UPI001F38FA78|nr:isoprenylcysteine carboxyl methyltransferase family protein [Saccharopolyspora terrae]
MVTQAWYAVLVGLVAAERLAELVIAQRNLAWSLARGGWEAGSAHYPFMVGLHTALLVGCVTEVWVADRAFPGVLGWTMLALVVASQALRWWCIRVLGHQWNTRIVRVPGLPPVTAGPYRVVAHPNYVAVVVEGFALPLVHGAWLTAAIFTALNTPLLTVRIRAEDEALRSARA